MAKRTKNNEIRSEKEETIISLVLNTHNNEMGREIARFKRDGWGLMTAPVFLYLGEPRGWNGAAVGYNHPHFMVLLEKNV